MSSFSNSYKNIYSMLSNRASELEEIIVSAIEGNGIKIKLYGSLEEFLSAEK